MIAPAALGYGLTIVVLVEVESEQINRLDELTRSFAACPQVQQCYYVAGEWDFVLLLLVRDTEQYNDLTRQLFLASHNVKRFKTLVTMSRVKHKAGRGKWHSSNHCRSSPSAIDTRGTLYFDQRRPLRRTSLRSSERASLKPGGGAT